MTKAIESGMPKTAHRRICRQKNRPLSTPVADVIVGVNKYKLAKEDPIDVLDIDNSAVSRISDQAPHQDALRARRKSLPGSPECDYCCL